MSNKIEWARFSPNGYEVSSKGDQRFSAFYARLNNGKTIEEIYQLNIKGYRSITECATEGKGKAPIVPFYTGIILPNKGTVMVFGSNPEGRHGAGMAKLALMKFGAKWGVGEGLYGNSYALPTKDLRIKNEDGSYKLKSISPEQIKESIITLYSVARKNPDLKFKVAYKNTDKVSLNGYTGYEMIEMFKGKYRPSNIIFSKEWADTGLLEPIERDTQWMEYKALWERYLDENPQLEYDLILASRGKVLTDKFATTEINQARALAEILTEHLSKVEPPIDKLANTSVEIPPEEDPVSQIEDKDWESFGYDIDEPCMICGSKGTKLEPRFNFILCKEHYKLIPIEVGRLVNLPRNLNHE